MCDFDIKSGKEELRQMAKECFIEELERIEITDQTVPELIQEATNSFLKKITA